MSVAQALSSLTSTRLACISETAAYFLSNPHLALPLSTVLQSQLQQQQQQQQTSAELEQEQQQQQQQQQQQLTTALATVYLLDALFENEHFYGRTRSLYPAYTRRLGPLALPLLSHCLAVLDRAQALIKSSASLVPLSRLLVMVERWRERHVFPTASASASASASAASLFTAPHASPANETADELARVLARLQQQQQQQPTTTATGGSSAPSVAIATGAGGAAAAAWSSVTRRDLPRLAEPASATAAVTRVWIWDIDETLLIFLRALSGGDGPHAQTVADRIEVFIAHVLAQRFSYGTAQLSHYNASSVVPEVANLKRDGSSSTADPTASPAEEQQIMDAMARVAFAYAESDLLGDLRASCEAAVNELDAACGGWMSSTRRSLDMLQQDPHTLCVAVSSSHLVPTLAKLHVYGLASFFPVSRVYSSRDVGKFKLFRDVYKRYGGRTGGTTSTQFVAVGDSDEEEHAAEGLEIPFIRIENVDHIFELENAIMEGFV